MSFSFKLPCLCIWLASLLWTSGCQRASATASKSEVPSKVTGAVKEDKLSVVELTEAATKRLGIETAQVELKDFRQHRTLAGEVILPAGATIIVSAPMTGRLQSPDSGTILRPGMPVVEKQAVMTLIPLLSPAEKIALATQVTDAEGQLQQARAVVEQRQVDLERAELQHQKGVGLKATLDTAKAQMVQSQNALDAAIIRKNLLNSWMDGKPNDEQKPFTIEAPQPGLIRAMHVKSGEFVTAGTPLFEVMNVETLWVRVPVYVGELTSIEMGQPAEVGELAYRPGQNLVKAVSVEAPPTATALSSTVDLYYELSNAEGKFRPGQRVSVQLPMTGNAEQSSIPWSAVVQDIYGSSWVYEQIGENKFTRRRVQVKQVVDSWATLEQGPPLGTTIVVTGVAEIFGTEFWVQK
jgi:cobalt-zinc-cadmium efflux system membrane fusion protein